jgi:glycosidase
MIKKNLLLIFVIIFAFAGSIVPADNININSPEQNVEVPGEFVPQWAKKVTWYQIFPERFMNGDTSNDPKLEDSKGSWPYDLTSAWQIHPWTSDWYEMQPYEKENGQNIWYNMQRRRYGGDVQGIMNKLDYMQELGVTAIYLNPVFEAPSLHKYDGATYHHIDPNFGPDPEGDRKIIASEVFDDPSTWKWTSADRLFLEFVKEVHKRGMYVIIDGVFNHMGTKSPAFIDLVENQQKSRFADWFIVKQWDNPAAGEKFDYEGWFGTKDLPEIKEDEKGIVEGPKKYIYAATKRWMDPNNNGDVKAGIDGWRLDVAFCVDHDFWKDWRKHVKSINKEAYVTGEVFLDSLSGFKDYLSGDEFDAVMDYPFLYTCSEYFVDEKHSINTTEFDRLLRELREMFPAGVAYVLQNLLDSHDTHRFASHIVNKNLAPYRKWGEFHGKSKAENPEYNTRKPNAEERELQKLVVLFQMTYPGAPMVYYGDEAGMWGANDPCDRKPMMWKDMDFANAVYLPDQSKKESPDKVEFDSDLFSYYKKVIAIRNSTPALQLGDFSTLLTDDAKELYSFKRSFNGQDVVVVLNNSAASQSAEINVPAGSYKDLMTDKTYEAKRGKLNISLDAKKGSVLARE